MAVGVACPKGLALQMLSQVRDGVVDWSAQQILAVVEFSEAHPPSLGLLLRKS